VRDRGVRFFNARTLELVANIPAETPDGALKAVALSTFPISRSSMHCTTRAWVGSPTWATVGSRAGNIRVPMSKPSGKYNVYNKINLSTGTSPVCNWTRRSAFRPAKRADRKPHCVSQGDKRRIGVVTGAL